MPHTYALCIPTEYVLVQLVFWADTLSPVQTNGASTAAPVCVGSCACVFQLG